MNHTNTLLSTAAITAISVAVVLVSGSAIRAQLESHDSPSRRHEPSTTTSQDAVIMNDSRPVTNFHPETGAPPPPPLPPTATTTPTAIPPHPTTGREVQTHPAAEGEAQLPSTIGHAIPMPGSNGSMPLPALKSSDARPPLPSHDPSTTNPGTGEEGTFKHFKDVLNETDGTSASPSANQPQFRPVHIEGMPSTDNPGHEQQPTNSTGEATTTAIAPTNLIPDSVDQLLQDGPTRPKAIESAIEKLQRKLKKFQAKLDKASSSADGATSTEEKTAIEHRIQNAQNAISELQKTINELQAKLDASQNAGDATKAQ